MSEENSAEATPLYNFNGNKITRGGEHVASYDAETQIVTAVEGQGKYLTSAKKFLTDEGIEWVKEAAVKPDESKENPPKDSEKSDFVPPVTLHDPEGDMPPTDPRYGSLTKEVMVWRLQQGEETFSAAYDGKVTPIGDFQNNVIDFDSLNKIYLGK